LADVTSNNWGGLTTIDNLSGLITVEATPNPRLSIYLNYGGDYAGREDYSLHGAITLSDPTAAEATPGGKWGSTWAIPTTQKAVGYGSYFTDNSGCNAITKPGINSGSSTGYLPGTACGAQTRDVQELTGGYWYDIYKGEHGRLRQGLQYGYAVREGWSGLNGIGAKGIDNMFWTTFRYYLP